MGVGEGSGAGCGSGILKCVLIVLNIIFGLVGAILLAVGIFIYVGLDKVANNLIGDQIKSLDTLMQGLNLKDYTTLPAGQTVDFAALVSSLAIPFIIFGLFLFICSFFGCCGACCSSKVLLIIYIVICTILLLAQIILVGLFFSGKLEPQIRKQISDRINKDYKGIDDYAAWSLAFNFIMTKFSCCGIDSYADFASAANWKKTRTFEHDTGIPGVGTVTKTVNLLTPMACCKFTGTFPDLGSPVDEECAYRPPLNPLINNYDKGCWVEINAELMKFKSQGLGALIGIIIAQAIVIGVAAIILFLMQTKADTVV